MVVKRIHSYGLGERVDNRPATHLPIARSFLYTYGILMELSMEHFVHNRLVTLRKHPSLLQKTASFCSFFSVAYPKWLVAVSTIDSTEDKFFISDATYN